MKVLLVKRSIGAPHPIIGRFIEVYFTTEIFRKKPLIGYHDSTGTRNKDQGPKINLAMAV